MALGRPVVLFGVIGALLLVFSLFLHVNNNLSAQRELLSKNLSAHTRTMEVALDNANTKLAVLHNDMERLKALSQQTVSNLKEMSAILEALQKRESLKGKGSLAAASAETGETGEELSAEDKKLSWPRDALDQVDITSYDDDPDSDLYAAPPEEALLENEGEVVGFLVRFVESIDDGDLNPANELKFDGDKDRMAVSLEDLKRTGNCDVVKKVLNSPNIENPQVHLVIQYVLMGDIGLDAEDDEKLLGRFYNDYHDNDNTVRGKAAEMKLAMLMRHRHFEKLGSLWLNRQSQTTDQRALNCFANVMMKREAKKQMQDMVLYKSFMRRGKLANSHLEIFENCGDNTNTNSLSSLQQLADLLLRPNRKAYPFWGRKQLQYHVQRQTVKRQLEYDSVLKWNLCVPAVEKIHLLLEHEDHKKFLQSSPKLQFHVLGERIKYQTAYNYIQSNIPQDKVAAVTNSDIMIGEGWDQLTHDRLRNQNSWALALSRHEAINSQRSTHVCCSEAYDGCHDTFIFATPLHANLAGMSDFQQNIWGAENAMINILCQLGITVANPCQSIRAYHYHPSAFRPRQNRAKATDLGYGSKVCAPSANFPPVTNCC